MNIPSFKEVVKERTMWIIENEQVFLCSEYMLSESIKPKQIDYGTDFENKQWRQLDHNFYVTFFKTTNWYVVFYREGFVGFGYIEKSPDEFTSIQQIFDHNPFKQTNFYQATHIFNYAFYILIQIIKKFNPPSIYFDASASHLVGVYEAMVKNKTFLQHIQKNGYAYKGKLNQEKRSFYTFERKNNI
jgi:hypothetical protein